MISWFAEQEREKDILFPVILTVSFVFCYFNTFIWLHHKYLAAESYFSHGYLVPLVSAYLIFRLKDRFATVSLSSAWFGLYITVAALAVHAFGVLGDVNFVSAFSMVAYLIGCVLYFLGKEFAKLIAFPLMFLFFMCPLPDAYLDTIALPFKSMATTLSLYIIDLAGIPCVREGFRLHLPEFIFVVGAPCNGLRSLISLSAIGLLFVYFIRSSRWKKLIFISLILPISIGLNGIRIAVLLFISHVFGHEAASPENLIHDGSGLGVFVLGLILLFLVGRLMGDEERRV
ncbi:MAG TPA: exosortase/archaeosortase family protein [Methanothrix soehngenii]|nr:exosortase/archaeosortase family protein [Methanothrix soehngenii]